jgi:hypothetical protein
MLQVKGVNIDGLPFDNLEVVSELLSFEYEPMLSHCRDERGNDWICYWADFDSNGKRWLYAKITKQELYDYLKGNKSLKKVFEELASEYVFLIDRDINEIFVSAKLINAFALPPTYFPGEGSYYRQDINDYYFKYLNDDNYLKSLRNNSFVFNLKPATKRHGETVGSLDAGQFLVGLTKSVRAYVEYEVNEIFKEKIPDHKTLTKFIKKASDQFSPRIPEVKYGSFEVSIAIDTITVDVGYEINFDWKKGIVEGYKKDVLAVNYGNDEEAKLISERFDPESRRRIYEPFMKVLENPDIKISVQNADRSLSQNYAQTPIKESFKRIVVPKPTKEEEATIDARRMRLITLTVAIEEGEDFSKINIRKLRDGLLFGDERPETDYIIHTPFEHNGFSIDLKKEIKSKFELEPNGIHRIYNTELDLLAEGEVFKEVENTFKDDLLNLFYEYATAKEDGKVNSDTRFFEIERHI